MSPQPPESKRPKFLAFAFTALAVAMLFLLIYQSVSDSDSTATVPADMSVAVLPFIAMSGADDDEYLADGLAEEILNALMLVPELSVVARMSSFHFKGQDISLSEIGSVLGVAHVLEGTVRRDGNRLRVIAQLVRSADNHHIWSHSYDVTLQDAFNVRTNIAENVATELGLALDDTQRARLAATGVREAEALVRFQKGIELFDLAHGSGTVVDSLLEANALFDQAIQIDPGFSDPYLYSADYFTHFLIGAIDEERISDDARDSAMQELVQFHENAIRHSSNEASRTAAAYDLAVISGQWHKLPALYDETTATSGCASTGWLLETSVPYGNATAALKRAESETRCNPMNFSGWVAASSAQLYLGNFDAAIETAHQGLNYSPHGRVYQQLVFALLAAGRFDDAEAIIDRHLHRESQSLPLRVMLSAAKGDAELANNLLRRLLESETRTTQSPIAQIAVTGDREAANTMAAKVDAIANGHLILALYSRLCRCGAPFDLESTPNFARLVRDAEFSWPPASPINWPMKDW